MVQEVQDQYYADYDAREFEDGDLVAARCHAGQAAGGALERGRKGGECLALNARSA